VNLSDTEQIVFNKYGTTLNIDDLSQVVKVSAATIRNKISNETFLIPTYTAGRKRLADFRDVAKFIDSHRPPNANKQ